jgi:hypothetical protein
MFPKKLREEEWEEGGLNAVWYSDPEPEDGN